jgi:hypothetical protein
MTELEGNEFDVPISTSMDPDYRYFRATKSSPSSKIYSISPLEAKKRRCRYVIYKQIDTSSYYGYRYDKDGNLEKFEWLTEEMRGRALRQWKRIDSMR